VAAALRVAYDMTFPNRNFGGTGVYARSLLDRVQRQGEVTTSEISGPSRSNFLATLAWLLAGARRTLRRRPADLLHCPGFVAPWFLPIPFVVTVHDAGGRRFPADHPLEWRAYDRAFIGGRLRSAARVITGSDFARKELVDAYGLDPGRVVTIPYGIDPRFLAVPAIEGGTDGERRMLFPGAPVGRKNLEAVLRVMAEAETSSAVGQAQLDVSGARAEDFPGLAALVRSLDLEGRVRWLGRVPAEEMPVLVSGAALVVYPSLYEGFGFPPLEAMAAGTPVVASDRGSLPEVLGEAALLVDPEDGRALTEALEAVLTRADLWARLREAGRARARSFSWERCAAATIQLYREVAAAGEGRG